MIRIDRVSILGWGSQGVAGWRGAGPGYPPFGPRAPAHLRATSNLNDSQMTLMWRRRLAP